MTLSIKHKLSNLIIFQIYYFYLNSLKIEKRNTNNINFNYKSLIRQII